MTEIDLDSVSKNIAALLMEQAAAQMANTISQARIQERANELIADWLVDLEKDASEKAGPLYWGKVDARADEIVESSRAEIEKLAHEKARGRIDSLADDLALQIATKKAQILAIARAEAILETLGLQVEAYSSAFLRECAIRAFLIDHDNEIHTLAQKSWPASPIDEDTDEL